jgi:hypothetical protein
VLLVWVASASEQDFELSVMMLPGGMDSWIEQALVGAKTALAVWGLERRDLLQAAAVAAVWSSSGEQG